MKKTTILFTLMLAIIFILAACSPNQPANSAGDNMMDDNMSTNSSDNMNDSHNDDMDDNMSDDNDMDDGNHEDMEDNNMSDDNDMDNENMSDEDAMEDESTDVSLQDYVFTDAVTGENFAISDFEGKVVLVETMAMWCSNCMKQQNQVKELHNLLGERDDFVSIGLDIDPNEELDMLKAYVEHNGYDWLYAVPPTDILLLVATTFGPDYLNPPSTPIALIDKEGNIHRLPFGIKSADELLGYVEKYLNE